MPSLGEIMKAGQQQWLTGGTPDQKLIEQAFKQGVKAGQESKAPPPPPGFIEAARQSLAQAGKVAGTNIGAGIGNEITKGFGPFWTGEFGEQLNQQDIQNAAVAAQTRQERREVWGQRLQKSLNIAQALYGLWAANRANNGNTETGLGFPDDDVFDAKEGVDWRWVQDDGNS